MASSELGWENTLLGSYGFMGGSGSMVMGPSNPWVLLRGFLFDLTPMGPNRARTIDVDGTGTITILGPDGVTLSDPL